MRQRLATLICSLLAVPLVWASASAAPPAPACDNTTRTAINGDTIILGWADGLRPDGVDRVGGRV